MLEHLQQLAIHCYYAGEADTGRRACERLLSIPGLPVEAERLARCNRTWYTQLLDELCPSASHVRIDVQPVHDGWSTFNPTLLNHGGDLIGIVRSSNYVYRDGRYISADADGWIRTKNMLVRFDADLAVVSSRIITEPQYAKTEFCVEGFEDCRLYHTERGVAVSATMRNAAPWTDGRCRIATADMDTHSATLSNMLVLDSVSTQVHEKNWMPILSPRGGWLYACSHDGHVVTVEPHPEVPGGWQMLRRSAAPAIASRFRGGSQLVPWRGGWLACVHECAEKDEHARIYEHRLVWFDPAFRLTKLSRWFAFRETRTIEFCAGLAVYGGRVVLGYGHNDATAWLCCVTEDDIESCLHDVGRDGLRADE